MLSRTGPYLLLALLGLAFFARLVLHPTQVLYSDHSDLLAEHVPAKRFLVSAWQRTGELPLWCPYNLGGMPFIHDPQLGAFYPLHLPLYVLPEQAVGPLLGWLTVVHVILAGWFMHMYAIRRELGRAGALIAAIGYMFAGKWMLHVLAGGHYVVLGLAWLPLLLLLLEDAMRHVSMVRATWAGVVLSLIVLNTHPQITLYTGLFVALWTLGPALELGAIGVDGTRSRRRTLIALGRWLGFGGWTVLVAVGLSAVQLLPSYEAATLSSRAAGVAPHNEPRLAVNTLFGPYLYRMGSWEYQGGLGVVWFAAACLSLCWCPRRVRWQAFVCVILFGFALGGHLLEGVPGFALFRTPGRMLLLATFPISFLAGAAMNALMNSPARTPGPRRRRGLALLGGVLAVALLSAWAAPRLDLPFQYFTYWASLVLTVPGMLVLLLANGRLARSTRLLGWGVLLLIDLWALSWPLVETRPEKDVYAVSPSVLMLVDNNDGHPRVLDRGWGEHESASPLGSGAPLAMLRGIEPIRGYNPLDVLRYKEYLQFISDRDTPLRALDGPLTFPVLNNFPLTNQSLLNLLGVRFILQPGDQQPPSASWPVLAKDEHPEAFDFVAGSRPTIPAYTLYENPAALPRAFVVPEAGSLPDRPGALSALKQTDFRRRVLLEEFQPDGEPLGSAGEFRPASITTYEPNRVVVAVEGKAPGWLVLADVWYPGWRCSVDERDEQLHRANFLFRAVRLPAGAHEVVFRFAPDSYRRGQFISITVLFGVVGLSSLAATWAWLQRRQVRKRPRPAT
jgi:hypothetical protein